MTDVGDKISWWQNWDIANIILVTDFVFVTSYIFEMKIFIMSPKSWICHQFEFANITGSIVASLNQKVTIGRGFFYLITDLNEIRLSKNDDRPLSPWSYISSNRPFLRTGDHSKCFLEKLAFFDQKECQNTVIFFRWLLEIENVRII